MKKRALFLLLALCLLFFLVPNLAAADSSGRCGGNAYWDFNEASGVLTVTGSGDMWDYDNLTCPWKGFREQITQLILLQGITRIGNNAFASCNNLTSVSLPEGLISIGKYAFSGCNNLTSLSLPEGLVSIGKYAFSNCGGLTELTLPSSLTSISTYAFSECTGLITLDIPDGITTVDDCAFRGCSQLAVIHLAETVTTIKTNSFQETAFWNDQPDGPVYLSHVLLGIKNNASLADTTLTVAPGTKAIADDAFSFVRNINTVVLPKGLIRIGNRAFYYCSQLSNLIIADGELTIGDEAFVKTKLTTPVLPEGVTAIGENAFYSCDKLTAVSLPSTLKSIGSNAFYLTSLDRVTYNGSQTMRQKIRIDSHNGELTEAAWRYSLIDVDALTFPDDAFRTWVLTHLSVSGSKAEGYTMTGAQMDDVTAIDCSNLGIQDLTGIEYFMELTTLNCSGNELTELNINSNRKLTTLHCDHNPLKKLSSYNCKTLEVLDCSYTDLTVIDMKSQVKLRELYCHHNPKLYNLTGLPETIYCLDCSFTGANHIWVKENAALVSLDCSNSSVYSLNLYAQPHLVSLNCSNNQLQKLDINQYPALEVLDCSGNSLPNLDVSQNPALRSLTCGGQTATAQSIIHNANGYSINMAKLAGDLSRVTILTEGADYDPTTGKLCFAFRPDSFQYLFAVGEQQMDVTVPIYQTLEQYLEINEANFPDEAFRQYLIQYQSNSGDDVVGRYFDPWQVLWVEEINCPGMGISSLKGIEYFTELTELNVGMASSDQHVSANLIKSLNLSKNTNLTSLNCSGNPLTSLNLSKHTKLKNVDCSYCKLTSLNVSKNSALISLNCSYNKLSSLTVSANTKLQSLICDGNKLSALDVSKNGDLVQLSCGGNKLSALNISKQKWLAYLDCSDNALTALDVTKNTHLQYLLADGNKLKTLNVNKNKALTHLTAEDNRLTGLNLNANTKLSVLACGGNRLETLDLSHNKQLVTLSCGNNKLKSLSLAANTQLTTLDCSDNRLSELDLAKNDQLSGLGCGGNRLTDLVLRSNPELSILDCSDNRLTTLDLSANKKLVGLFCSGNRLTSLDLTPLTALQIAQWKDQVLTRQKLTETEEGFAYDLSALVPDTTRVTLTAEGTAYAADTGLVTFPTEVEDFTYVYETGKGDMPVTVRFNESVTVRFIASPTAVSVDLQVYEKDGTTEHLMAPKGEGEYRLIPGEYRLTAVITYQDSSVETIKKSFTVSETSVGPMEISLKGKPWIVTQPVDVMAHTGEKAKFTVQTSGTVKSFQWYYRTSETAKWKKVSKATKATLTVTAKPANNGYQYRCEVKNANGKLYTNIVMLTVDLHPPILVSQPESAAIKAGEEATFTFGVEGEGVTYAWSYRKGETGKWAAVKGGTQATMTVTGTAANAGYQYKCEAKNKDGSVTSDIVTLDVEYHLPEITLQPKGAKVKKNAKVTFTVEANDPYEEELTFQWYYRKSSKAKWTKIKGATEATYSFKATAKKNGYQYKCDVANRDSTVSTKAVTLKVK